MMKKLRQKHREWQEDRRPMIKHGSVMRPTVCLASTDIKTAFDVARRKHIPRIVEGHTAHGWMIAALLREMAGLEGLALFECAESKFSFARCIRQGSVEAPRLWQKMAMQILANVEQGWKKERMGVVLDLEGKKKSSNLQFHVCRHNCCAVSHSKTHLERMMKDLVQEAGRWDVEPKPASLWWTSTYDSEEKNDLSIDTETGRERILFEEMFFFFRKKIGFTMHRQG